VSEFLLVGPVGVGIYYVLLREMRGEPVEFGMMFKGFEKFVPAMAVGLIQSIPGIIWTVVDYAYNIASLITEIQSKGWGDFYQADDSKFAILGGISALYVAFTVVFLIVSIVWGIAFMFALPLVADHDLDPISALKLSAQAARRRIDSSHCAASGYCRARCVGDMRWSIVCDPALVRRERLCIPSGFSVDRTDSCLDAATADSVRMQLRSRKIGPAVEHALPITKFAHDSRRL